MYNLNILNIIVSAQTDFMAIFTSFLHQSVLTQYADISNVAIDKMSTMFVNIILHILYGSRARSFHMNHTGFPYTN